MIYANAANPAETDEVTEEISRYVQELNDLLYDFEDYADGDGFDVKKFAELQGLSRKSAPAISHIITRMKLEVPRVDDAESTSSRVSSERAATQYKAILPYPDDRDLDGHDTYTMPDPYPESPGLGLDARSAEPSPGLLLPTVHEEEPQPRPPPCLEPWSHRSQNSDGLVDIGNPWRGIPGFSDSAVGSEAGSEQEQSPIIGVQHFNHQQPTIPPRIPHRIVTPTTQGPLPDQTASTNRTRFQNIISPISPLSDQRDSYAGTVSPVSRAENRISAFSPLPQHEIHGQGFPYVAPLAIRSSSSASTLAETHDDLRAVRLPALGVPDGLIPVEAETEEPVSPPPETATTFGGCVINLNSSYYQLGGFCSSAMEVIQGGLGFKHIKKQVSSMANQHLCVVVAHQIPGIVYWSCRGGEMQDLCL